MVQNNVAQKTQGRDASCPSHPKNSRVMVENVGTEGSWVLQLPAQMGSSWRPRGWNSAGHCCLEVILSRKFFRGFMTAYGGLARFAKAGDKLCISRQLQIYKSPK